MPQMKTQQRRPATTKKTAARKRSAAPRSPGRRDSRSAAKRTAKLSEDVLQELEDGAQSAIEAVRKFLSTVDEALPPRGEGPSRREEIVDSALEMTQRLVHTQSDFLRKVVDSAGRSLTRSDDDAK